MSIVQGNIAKRKVDIGSKIVEAGLGTATASGGVATLVGGAEIVIGRTIVISSVRNAALIGQILFIGAGDLGRLNETSQSRIMNRTGKSGWSRESGTLDKWVKKNGYTKGAEYPGKNNDGTIITELIDSNGKKIGEIHTHQPCIVGAGRNKKIIGQEPIHVEYYYENTTKLDYLEHIWFPEEYGWKS